jgi:hypothetical protein
MADILLHLVDENGHPVPAPIRAAIEAAHRWALKEYKYFDRAVLAGMAEAVALSMCRRLDQIDFPGRYAFTALTGKLQEWYRAHPAVEVLFDQHPTGSAAWQQPLSSGHPTLF